MGALIIAHVDAPKYVDPCLWSCMHLYPQPAPPPKQPAPDLFTGLYEESKALVAGYAEWPMDFSFGIMGESMVVDNPPDEINHEFI